MTNQMIGLDNHIFCLLDRQKTKTLVGISFYLLWILLINCLFNSTVTSGVITVTNKIILKWFEITVFQI